MSNYFESPFGDGVDVGSGGNVTTSKGTPHNTFGPRDVGDTVGVIGVTGMTEQLVLMVTGRGYNDGVDAGLVGHTLPEGAVIKAVYVDVEEAFDLGGTNPVLDIGENGAAATNGVTIDDTPLEATGTTNQTANLSGEWDAEAPLPHDQVVQAVFSADSALTVADTGRARITIIYDRANRTL